MGSNRSEVVISGISGRFPSCLNVQEFKEKLFSKEMMLVPDEKRWNPLERGKPLLTGKIPDEDKFDISFFRVTPKLLRVMNPVGAPTVEVSTEAIVDAGVNPFSLRGRSVSVVFASSISDAEVMRCFEGVFSDSLSIQGLSRSMIANRISYTFGFTGPSYNIDSSWVSAVQGLELAATLVSQGHVEAAVVSCVNLIFNNSIDREYSFMDTGLYSETEKCSPFDAKADGFLRSEGTVAFFIQRAQDAKRHYCTILSSQTRCLSGFPGSFTSINPYLETFFRDFYASSQTNPKDVSYVETFGFCNKDRDAQELNSIANIFCEKRHSPLMIGCGTGNYGISETASSFITLTKAIIALEEGVIPPTINYTTPNPNVPGLINGQLKPVTESTKLPGDLVAVDCMSFSGNVAHTLLRQNSKSGKPKCAKGLPEDGLPRLIILQARHEDGIDHIIKKVAAEPVNPDFVSLVNDVFRVPIPHYLYKGYSIVPGQDNTVVSETKELGPVGRPLWYLFSGMGSQWVGMGRELMRIPTFAAAIAKCDECLRPLGVDIQHVLTSDDQTIFDDIVNCFVGITSVQIGLVDCLRTLGVEPDGILGHSAGETACAYADGCFTLQETILASYYRGKTTTDNRHTLQPGMMAAVGIGYEDIKVKLPPTIDVACHNAADSVTISGPEQDVKEYLDTLKQKGVFAKAVNSTGVAYHSRYVSSLGPILCENLKKVIKTPKPRTSRWLSTSAPQSQWTTEAARLCSPQYHTNNLVNPVYFEEACSLIPKNATIIEIAPHGLLQAILRRSISTECVNISLTSRNANSNLYHFLGAIGKLHLNNVDLDVNALYPAVEYPVARGTPYLSTLVTWDHLENRLAQFRADVRAIIEMTTAETIFPVGRYCPDMEKWREHRVDGVVVLPVSQLLMYPCAKVFSKKGRRMEVNSVIFEDVIISEQVPVKQEEHLLLVAFAPASSSFEMALESTPGTGYSGRHIVTGKLQSAKVQQFVVPELTTTGGKVERVNSKQIYEVLLQSGYQLGPRFKVIKQLTTCKHECVAKIKWTADEMVFVDALFKVLTYLKIEEQPSLLHLPTAFRSLHIHKTLLSELPINTVLDVHYDKRSNRLVCLAAEILGATFKSTFFKNNGSLIWRELKFRPYFETSPSLKDFLNTSIQLVKEADLGTWMKISPPLPHLILVRPKNVEKQATYEYLKTIIFDHSELYGNVSEEDEDKVVKRLKSAERRAYLVVGDQSTVTSLAETATTDRLYCITIMKPQQQQSSSPRLRPILFCSDPHGELTLLKKIDTESPMVVTLEGKDWLVGLRRAAGEAGEGGGTSTQPLVLVTRTLLPRQVLPVLAAESFTPSIRTVFIQQASGSQFSASSPAFSSQLLLGLPVNVLSDGVWGSLRTVDVDFDLNNNFNSFFNRGKVGIDMNYVGLNPPTFDKNNNLSLPILRTVDYSGCTVAEDGVGERVMGVGQVVTSAGGPPLRPDPLLSWPVPEDWTLVDAATVPVAYGLAYYCVRLKAKVKAGERVLVHSGTSPVSQALIWAAIAAGAHVITWVTTTEEKRALRNRFPQLDPKNIIIKSTEGLEIPVKKLTQGKGVEVVVNCLRGKEFQSSTKLLAGTDGRFLHLGHISVEERESIGLQIFMPSLAQIRGIVTSMYGVTVENLTGCSQEEKVEIQQGILDGIMKGDVKPLKRKTFSYPSKSNIIESLRSKNMEDKTILCLKEESTTRKSLYFNPEEFVVIAGTTSSLWMEVASWVVANGGQHLILLTSENVMVASNFHKIDKLVSNLQGTFTFHPFSKFDSIQGGVDIFEELMKMRPIDSLICINMDENSPRLRNMDLASRKAVPRLRRFVSLLGGGAAVCEARAHSGLPVCCVQKASPLQNPTSILPYLTNILSDTSTNSSFFVVEDSFRKKMNSVVTTSQTEIQKHLPQSVAELENLASNMADTELREVPSLSPQYEYIRHQLLPFFVIPGLSSSRLEKLTQQLMHPVFSPTLPPSLPTVEQCATYLLEEILTVRETGPYNLIAESWSVLVTLHLASLLEARGHRVSVFLLDASPSSVQTWARTFRRPTGLFASDKFLSCILGSQRNVPKGLDDLSSWEEQLDLLVEHLKCQQETLQVPTEYVKKYLSALKTRITGIMDYTLHNLNVKATVHLIQTREPSKSELVELSKSCQQRPLVHVLEDDVLTTVIEHPKTRVIINENAIFSWK